jgi:hypothetical protein
VDVAIRSIANVYKWDWQSICKLNVLSWGVDGLFFWYHEARCYVEKVEASIEKREPKKVKHVNFLYRKSEV